MCLHGVREVNKAVANRSVLKHQPQSTLKSNLSEMKMITHYLKLAAKLLNPAASFSVSIVHVLNIATLLCSKDNPPRYKVLHSVNIAGKRWRNGYYMEDHRKTSGW